MASQRSSAMGGGGGGSVGGYSGRPPVQGQYGGHGAAGSSSSSMGRGSGVAAVKARRGVAEGQGLGQGQRPGQGGTFLTGMDYADDELSDAELARQTRRRQQVGILLSTKPLSPPVLYLHMNHHQSLLFHQAQASDGAKNLLQSTHTPTFTPPPPPFFILPPFLPP